MNLVKTLMYIEELYSLDNCIEISYYNTTSLCKVGSPGTVTNVKSIIIVSLNIPYLNTE